MFNVECSMFINPSTYWQEIEEEPERNPERQAYKKSLHAKLCEIIP